MRPFAAALALLLLSACATLGIGGSGGSGRQELWEQAHAAFARDSFRVAEALFQRLANEHPRTHEGHEARFYLGVLNMEPRSRIDLPAAVRHFEAYLADDSLQGGMRGYHTREAESYYRLAVEIQRPCGQRSPGLPCDTAAPTVVTRTVPGEAAEPAAGTVSAAEAARLRRELAERNATIQQLRDELQRIRNTLAPRNPRE